MPGLAEFLFDLRNFVRLNIGGQRTFPFDE
jgi:hypothetical protein